MKPINPFAKYLTAEQLLVYAELYEGLIHKRESFARAVETLSQVDPRRDRSSVVKTLSALNQKMLSSSVKSPLLQKGDDQGDSWVATEAGRRFFELALAVKKAVEPFDEYLQSHERSKKEITLAARTTSMPTLRKAVPAATRENHESKIFADGIFSKYLEDDGFDIVFDEIFFNEKPYISSSDYFYWQFSAENIVIVANPRNVSFDSNATQADEAGMRSIEAKSIPQEVTFFIPKRPLYFRIAASVANLRLSEEQFVSAENERKIKEMYKNCRIVNVSLNEDIIEYLANQQDGYALVIPESECDRIDNFMGVRHKRYYVLNGNKRLYYNYGAFVTRQTKNKPHNDELLIVMQAFDKAAPTNLRTLKDTSSSIDYSSSGFACAHCGNRLSYKELDGEFLYRAACDDCLWVTEFNSEFNTARAIMKAGDIRYTSNFKDGNFQCETCDTEFDAKVLTNKRGHPYFACPNCCTVYQDGSAKAESIHRRCGASNCTVEHQFRISKTKRTDTVSCYNSYQCIEYNADSDTIKMAGELDIKPVYLDEIKQKNKFACPHFGCGKEIMRPAITNARGEHYSHCTNCGNDIAIHKTQGA